MAQAYGAFQPIIDLANKASNAFNLINKLPTPHGKVDTSWHDQMVKNANESFRKAAAGAKKPVSSSGQTPKKRAAKKAQRKAVTKR